MKLAGFMNDPPPELNLVMTDREDTPNAQTMRAASLTTLLSDFLNL